MSEEDIVFCNKITAFPSSTGKSPAAVIKTDESFTVTFATFCPLIASEIADFSDILVKELLFIENRSFECKSKIATEVSL